MASLSVSKEQIHMIESNKDCLLEAAFDTHLEWQPLAIYAENIPIGFTMIGALDEKPGTIWLDRFMIDYRYQGKKYGKNSLALILNYISTEYPDKKILLSVHRSNNFAINLYKSFGFKLTEEIDPDNQEIIMIK
ncbi:GNAT family N-acetyltransferase [Vagococcus coleopterorum]|uniref:GNAT family N-acetyltransferase n=1 Tax=Vagococcus coleopterorum TaxID=2714946 RepID=A0A6G8AM68_9ENTE|nr:GNAT family N-acetyltransferase [Vagococcus coleopterorum]QIL46025.1 GNAT family N-acetyltransferase [Vagococcus coleopterorum]